MKTKTAVQTVLREPIASRARQFAIREDYEQAARAVATNVTTAPKWVRWFDSFGLDDLSLVGGKNASLGEMMRELSGLGICIPDGFAVTAEGYRHFIAANHLHKPITQLLADLKPDDVESLEITGRKIRNLILKAKLPDDLKHEIEASYRALSGEYNVEDVSVAVRSSATAEDLPGASFAGAHSTSLHVHGEADVLDAVRKCFASLFNPRAIRYRVDMGFAHSAVALSVGIQKIVRSDLSSSGVIFTLDTESGFRDVVMIDGVWGMGENIVQGKVIPDDFYVHKPTLAAGFKPLIWKKLGAKEFKLIYDEHTQHLKNIPTPADDRARFCISDEEVLQLARWAVAIENHYTAKHGQPTPMDIEWARDGLTGQLFIVQARPETVHAMKKTPMIQLYSLKKKGHVLMEGLAVGEKIAAGAAHIIKDPKAMGAFKAGEVLVTEITDPDWEPIMKIASAIVTERGGRTSHAAIVARELGIPAVVGTRYATEVLKTGKSVTVSCAEGEVGHVYEGALKFDVEEIDPTTLGETRTQIMCNIGDPEQAFKLAQLPNDGVGLARMEFIFASWVKVHPLALLHFGTLPIAAQREIEKLTAGYADKAEYFVDKLAQGIGTLAAAFWPKPVILRFSDFKTNEYAHLIGGQQFEPHEDNPMLGWRGASRYYHPDYKPGFMLEVRAVKRVREVFGLKNLIVMIPFCRTPEEGEKVMATMREGGLVRRTDHQETGLEVYVMAEIPSNVILAEDFCKVFDGFSIGSNDLTQLVLGVDRDSERVAPLFDERNDAVKRACADLIATAHRHGRKVGICGQAPSDYPDFAAFLVEQGIDSISLNPDSIVRVKKRIQAVENLQK
jgi:pyruvate, water dikinase